MIIPTKERGLLIRGLGYPILSTEVFRKKPGSQPCSRASLISPSVVGRHLHVSYLLNSLKGGYIGDYTGNYHRGY